MPYRPSTDASSSSTSFLFSSEEVEKHLPFTVKPTRLRRFYQALSKRRYYINGISILHQACFTALVLCTVITAYLLGTGVGSPSAPRSFVPPIRRLSGSITFEDSPDWSGNTTHAATKWHKWLANFETHTIAIPRRQIEEYAYQPGLPDTRDSERYGIAMFHQLHCLATIREFAYLPDAQRMPSGKPLDHDGVTFSSFHMDHCYNYLRQAIECFGDSTVEPAKVDAQGTRMGIQGWGVPRYQCRDWSALERFALEHHEL